MGLNQSHGAVKRGRKCNGIEYPESQVRDISSGYRLDLVVESMRRTLRDIAVLILVTENLSRTPDFTEIRSILSK